MKMFSRLLVLCLTVLGTAAFAQQPGGPQGPGATGPRGPQQPGFQNRDEMMKKWGLSEAQISQVKDLMKKLQTATEPQRTQLKDFQTQIEKAMMVNPTDLGAVNALVDKKAQVGAELEKQFLATGVQVHKIVGDEVFGKMAKAMMRHPAPPRQDGQPQGVPQGGQPGGSSDAPDDGMMSPEY